MVGRELVRGVEIPKSMGISFCESVRKGRYLENLSSQWEKSVWREDYSVCIVMCVGLCLQTLLVEEGT